MASRYTRAMADTCARAMQERGYQFRTLLNIGVGSAPEFRVWKRWYPDHAIVGVDPKPQRAGWTAEYIRAAVGDGSTPGGMFCCRCRSVKCPHCRGNGNRLVAVPCTTIDAVAANRPGPYFLWMDIEGAELDALKGAEQTLAHTDWINVEIQEMHGTTHYVKDLHAFLAQHGYEVYFTHPGGADRLYRKP